jgi:hypothetical protein
MFICALYWIAGVLAWSFLTCASVFMAARYFRNTPSRARLLVRRL